MGASGSYSGGPLSIDFEILEFVWRSLVLLLGLIIVIPAPWVLVWYIKWIVPCVHVPGRPNMSFEGEAMTIVPWFFGLVVLMIGVGMIGSELLSNLMILVQMAFYWPPSRRCHRPGPAARAQLFRLGLGLPRLDHSCGHLRPYHHWLGVGLRSLAAMVLPEHPGYAARSPLHRQRPGVSVACDRGRSRQHLHHPDTMGISMDVTVAGVADRSGRERRARERLRALLALAHRAFLGHRRHQRAVGLEDQAAGQSAAVLRAG